jgi:hypothetical protein
MNILKPYVLIHEHSKGRSVYGFNFRPTKTWMYPSARRVAKKLGLKLNQQPGENISLHAMENDPPDRVLTAASVGCRSAEFMEVEL